MRTLVIALMPVIASCGSSGDDASTPDAGAPTRELEADLTVDTSGFSNELSFEIPDGTRSLTVVVTGDGAALYALGSLRLSDGIEQVGLDLSALPGLAMRASYDDEQIGQMPGNLFQSIRLGTFTQVYPYRPGQLLPAGPATLRVASDTPGDVQVTVLLPVDDASSTLHLNLVAVSDRFTLPPTPTFLDEVQAIFAQAGIEVVVDTVIAVPGSGLSAITESTEPQEAPGSMAAMLPALAGDRVAPAALDVLIVDSLPFGIGGLSLGTPGPPTRGSYYYGVILAHLDDDGAQARVLAHEVCHFLALQHVSNTGVSGMVYPDPLDDTQPGQGNLMETGTALTADQGFALSRSALLQPQ